MVDELNLPEGIELPKGLRRAKKRRAMFTYGAADAVEGRPPAIGLTWRGLGEAAGLVRSYQDGYREGQRVAGQVERSN